MMTSISFVFQAVWMLLTNLCSKISIDEYQNYSHVTIICLKCYAVKVSQEYDQDRGVLFFCSFSVPLSPMEGGGLLFHASWTAHPWSQKLRMSWITHKRHFRKGNQIYLSPELMHEKIILLWIWYFTFYGKRLYQVVIVSYHIPETLSIKYSSKPPPPKIPALFRCIKRL